MSGALGIGISGLMTYQNAISTTTNNISNVNTEGYSRQTAILGSRPSTSGGGFYIGSGVDLTGILRNTDSFAEGMLSEQLTNQGASAIYFENANRLSTLFSNENTALSTAFNDFYTAIDALASTPNDVPTRQDFLSKAELLVNRFHGMHQTLTEHNRLLNVELGTVANNISSLGQGIADINNAILGKNPPPPDLLDERKRLVDELAKLVSTDTIVQEDGSMTVMIGTGQNLVVGGTSATIEAQVGASDPEKYVLKMVTPTGSIDITNNIVGGELGGLLDFREDLLAPSFNILGRMAIGFAEAFNDQHKMGVDSNGNLGQNFFVDINNTIAQGSRIIPDSNNSGVGQLHVDITDSNQLTDDEYRLLVSNNGSTFSLYRNSTSELIASTSVGGYPASIQAEGFSIELTATGFNDGDSFIVSPTRSGASLIEVNIKQQAAIAVASPIITSSAVTNSGDGEISMGEVMDITNAAFSTTPGQLSPPIRVEFLSATTYQLVNDETDALIEGPIGFTPGITNEIFPTPGSTDYGYRLQISNQPDTGDSFTIGYNGTGAADNRNAISLNEIQNKGIFSLGSNSVTGVYSELVSAVGTNTRQAEINLNASDVLVNQARLEVESTSGVNLDEEAAKLIQYQQAYQANAQVIQIASSLFDILLTSLAR